MAKNNDTERYEQFCVYALCDPLKSGKIFYIGKGKRYAVGGFKGRLRSHLHKARRGHRSHMCHTIRKIEAEGLSVVFTILSTWQTEQAALDEERRMIAKIGLDNLTNVLPGGTGYSLPDEVKKKISIANTNPSEETRIKRSLSAKGQIPWTKGKSLPLKTREKISNSLLGHEVSSATREKISASQAGRAARYKMTDEIKRKISASLMGHRHSQETKDKISRATKGKVIPRDIVEKMTAARGKVILSPDHLKKLQAGRELYWLSRGRQRLISVLAQIAA